MPEETNLDRPRGETIASDFRRAVPTVILAVVTALGASWCNTQSTQVDSARRLTELEKKVDANAEAIRNLSRSDSDYAIRLAELALTQKHLAEQIAEIKQAATK